MMNKKTWIYVVVTNGAGCEIFRDAAETMQEVRNIIAGLLDTVEPGDNIHVYEQE